MAEVAGILISPFLEVVFKRMASREFLDFFRRRKVKESLVQKLKIELLGVNKVLEDAEDKQLTDFRVKEWLDDLKDTVYDAENILDEIATEALQRKLDAEFQTTASKVRNSISTSLSPFVREIELKIKEILHRLEYLAKQKHVLGLKESSGVKPVERLPSTSLVEESGTFGRDDDKEDLVKLLLLGGSGGEENMSVIAVVGMGGIGKTTLAQLVYKDSRVNENFELKAWVCVSDEFNVLRLTKTILEEVGLTTKGDSKNLNRLQVALNEQLMGKRFLIVLDDVWNESYADWEALSNPFKSGKHGSKVIVTTRNKNVASVMHSVAIHRLKQLPEKDCWLLFAKHAFQEHNFDRCPKLKEIGKQIVKKCKGLPLAIKTIGGLLRSNLEIDEWERILESDLWISPPNETNVLPALRLSYKNLPSKLKQCFVYCSIFPKDYAFEKNQVILLWMAEGFLEQFKDKTMEKVGEEYFLALESRSLFEQSMQDKSCFVMHDLINDLAKFVSGQFTFRLKVDHCQNIGNKTHHFSYFRRSYDNFTKFKDLYKARKLRTFLQLEFSRSTKCFHLSRRVCLELLPRLKYLRVFSLSHYRNMMELPMSIDKLKHLRYLNFSFTTIKRLPTSICKLCNLQTLNLLGCHYITMLPRDMWKLVNLRHLDILGTNIKEMPLQLGKLKCLQTLTKFIVSRHSGACIKELEKLKNLRGKLTILELQNVVSPADALVACLKDRKFLEDVVLEWNALDISILDCQQSVLENLQPHKNLKSLVISNYSAKSFPTWVGNPSFLRITSLHLNNCKHCCDLPSLGLLCSLQDLSIVGFDEVVSVGCEFYGSSPSPGKAFGALKVLRFEHMSKWEKWLSVGSQDEAFAQLEELYIGYCPKLTGALPIHLSSLAKIEIYRCPQLLPSLSRAPAIHSLRLSCCNDVLLNELPTGPRKLQIEDFGALESLPKGMMNLNNCLQELQILNCPKLEFPAHLDYSSLEILRLCGCDSLKSLPLDLFLKLHRLEISWCTNLKYLTAPQQHGRDLAFSRIEIKDCPSLVCFPEGGFRAPNLTYFEVEKCGNLRSLPEKMHIFLPSVREFYIIGCPQVEPFSQGDLPTNVQLMKIEDSDKLFASRKEWGLEKLTITYLSIGGEHEDVESFMEPGSLPSSLIRLKISGFPNLKSLDNRGLQCLTSLERFWVSNCPKLQYMPEELLPTSLTFIRIDKCPLLKKRWQTKKGRKRNYIPNVDRITIDEEFIE